MGGMVLSRRSNFGSRLPGELLGVFFFLDRFPKGIRRPLCSTSADKRVDNCRTNKIPAAGPSPAGNCHHFVDQKSCLVRSTGCFSLATVRQGKELRQRICLRLCLGK
jgi:hypothetical protein